MLVQESVQRGVEAEREVQRKPEAEGVCRAHRRPGRPQGHGGERHGDQPGEQLPLGRAETRGRPSVDLVAGRRGEVVAPPGAQGDVLARAALADHLACTEVGSVPPAPARRPPARPRRRKPPVWSAPPANATASARRRRPRGSWRGRRRSTCTRGPGRRRRPRARARRAAGRCSSPGEKPRAQAGSTGPAAAAAAGNDRTGTADTRR